MSNEEEPYAEMLESMTGYYVDEEINKVVVEIDDLNEEKKEAFKELFVDDECVEFEEGDKIVATASKWKPGRRIFMTSGAMSTGYRAYWYGYTGTRYNGFATAGHGVSAGENVYVDQKCRTALGTCMSSCFSGNSDSAFVAITNSNYKPSNKVFCSNEKGDEGGVTLSKTLIMSGFAKGSLIYKAGFKSFLTSGKIKSTSATITYGGKKIKDLLKTKAVNLKGDSGGVAYMLYDGSYIAAGTMAASGHTGSELTEETFTYSYVSKINLNYSR